MRETQNWKGKPGASRKEARAAEVTSIDVSKKKPCLKIPDTEAAEMPEGK